jgi:hypothetical protein
VTLAFRKQTIAESSDVDLPSLISYVSQRVIDSRYHGLPVYLDSIKPLAAIVSFKIANIIVHRS